MLAIPTIRPTLLFGLTGFAKCAGLLGFFCAALRLCLTERFFLVAAILLFRRIAE
jgi:hypothetical protein